MWVWCGATNHFADDVPGEPPAAVITPLPAWRAHVARDWLWALAVDHLKAQGKPAVQVRHEETARRRHSRSPRTTQRWFTESA